jgi:hypothetical protein
MVDIFLFSQIYLGVPEIEYGVFTLCRYRKRTLCPAHEKNAGDLEIGHESIRYVI